MSDPIPPESRGRVLLADDDTTLSSIQARALRSDGYAVTVVANGDDAIARLNQGPFDVLLSDIQMPGLSGVDLLREVRAHDLDLPVVLMTGAPSVDTAALAVELGALKYLTKPVPLELLLMTTAKACQLRRMGQLKREAMAVLGLRATAAGDRAGLAAGFDRMLDGLGLAFQPIVDPVGQRIVAYEALMRSEEITLPDPAAVLDAADRLDRVHELGRRVRLLAARSLTSAPEGVLLFVNLHSRDLEDSELFDRASPLTALAPRVVLEITERASVGDIKEVRERVAELRELEPRRPAVA